jgi:hypothetical protein
MEVVSDYMNWRRKIRGWRKIREEVGGRRE